MVGVHILLISLFGFFLALMLVIGIPLYRIGYKVHSKIKENPELDSDPKWEEGFTVDWYSETFNIRRSTAKAFLELACALDSFSKEEVNKITIYKMKMKQRGK